MDNEEVPSAPSTPATPGTPGAPLFGGFKGERGVHGRKSLLRSCKCFGVEEWAMEEGRLPPVSCSLPPPPVSLARKPRPLLTTVQKRSETLIGLAASTGLAAMIVILSTGHISGAHLNPSITIAFAALKHFPWKHVPLYIGAQVLASVCAAFALKGIFHPMMGGGVTVPSGGHGQAFALEFIISFILMFVVTAVATDTRAVSYIGSPVFRVGLVDHPSLRSQLHAHVFHIETRTRPGQPLRQLAGIAVGATVMLNILIAGETTGASMNPVRTLGPAIAANNYTSIWVYLTAPILGALCGAGTYSAVKLPEEDGDANEKTSATRSFRR
uniref:Aquaporin n=1 Tax=Salix viminalis TaxID=40686 RepID=A0A6N2MBT3_SALVM